MWGETADGVLEVTGSSVTVPFDNINLPVVTVQ